MFHYVFDIIQRHEKLKEFASGSARIIPFEKFIESGTFAGSSLLAGLIDKSIIDDFNIVGSRNKSLTGLDREARYLLAYCNIDATTDNYNQLKDEFDFFI